MKILIALIIFTLIPVSAYCLSDREAFELLMLKSQSVEAFPLHVYTTPDVSKVPPDRGPFRGTALPIASYGFFASAYPDLKESDQPNEILATYRFSQVTRWRCFLLRVPSMYAVEAVDLWVFDTEKGTWQKPLRIADSWGDAGEEFDIQSWIFDINGDGAPDILRKMLRAYRDPADSGSKVTIVERKYHAFIWDEGCFKDESLKYLPKINLKVYRLVNKEIQ